MVELTIRFLSGRYHATGWDHHVNEGTVEWPPSPWRLLRALVAASYRMTDRPSDDALSAVLSPLAERLPVYTVPPYSEGQTRHFMPLDNKGLTGDKSALIYDAFVAPGSGADAPDGELSVCWPGAEMSDGSFELLCSLCDRLSYLGRAESWAEVRASRTVVGELSLANCTPVDGEPEQAGVRLLALAPQSDHLAWFGRAKAAQGKPKALPKSLLDVLRQDIGELRGLGWSGVPGTRWVVYDHKRAVMPRARRVSQRSLPTIALYRIDGTVLPPVQKALQVGEVLHRALVAQSKRVAPNGKPLAVFTGQVSRDVDPGEHAAVMPLDLDRDGRIDHALVVARGGYDARAITTLRRVRRLYGIGSLELFPTVVAEWTADDIAHVPVGDLPAPLRASKVWRSVTPYVLTRHPKVTRKGRPRLDAEGLWRDGPEQQLRAELARLVPHATIANIREIPRHQLNGRELDWYRFQRQRHHGGGRRGLDKAFGFEVTFTSRVSGPIAAGYGRFFGLGQFAPAQ